MNLTSNENIQAGPDLASLSFGTIIAQPWRTWCCLNKGAILSTSAMFHCSILLQAQEAHGIAQVETRARCRQDVQSSLENSNFLCSRLETLFRTVLEALRLHFPGQSRSLLGESELHFICTLQCPCISHQGRTFAVYAIHAIGAIHAIS